MEKIIPSQRHLFEMPEDVAYLNCAYMAPMSKAVLEAGRVASDSRAQPWKYIKEADFFAQVEKARSTFATLVGTQADNIAITPSISYGIASAAVSIKVKIGAEILVQEGQFPSHVYIWRKLAMKMGAVIRTVSPNKTENGPEWTTPILEAINENTAIAAVQQCQWTDGGLLDIESVAEQARKFGAALVLDTIQSTGVLPINIERIRPDFLCCACYKWLLGPYSFGFMYVSPEWQRRGSPLEEPWSNRINATEFARLTDYQREYQEGARKFDMGQKANFHLAPMATAATEQILAWGVENIAHTLGERTLEIAEGLEELGFSCTKPPLRAKHYLTASRKEGIPEDLRGKLAERNVYVSIRSEFMRITPHLYNTDADIKRLFTALKEVL